MAVKTVEGDILLMRRGRLEQKFDELRRQLELKSGYPYDFEALLKHLQRGIEGEFEVPQITEIDQQTKRKGQLRRFFKECFGIKMPQEFYGMKLPFSEKKKYFMYVPASITLKQLRNVETIFSGALYGGLANLTDENAMDEQRRPTGDYWIGHVGDVTPDMRHRNKHFLLYTAEEQFFFMTLKEYMLCRLFAYWLDKTIWDYGTLHMTMTSTLYEGWVACGYYQASGKAFELMQKRKDWRGGDCSGPREIVIL